MSGTNLPPDLTVFSNGTGVLIDQQLNTFVQGGALLANLRSFPGVQNLTVWMIGYTTANDGGQGMFYWNSAAITADDGGVTTIAPYGVLYGRWIRLSTTSTSSATATNGIFINSASVSASYTIASGYNALSAGPVTLAAGVTVTVSTGQRWVIL